MSLLAAAGMTGGYGGVDVLRGLTVRVAAGELVVIVGPNGAGKSTALKAIAGLVALRAGSVVFDGRDVTALRTNQRAAAGLGYVPQERNVFPGLSVQENLEMGAFLGVANVRRRLDTVYALFPVLAERRRQAAGSMSGGERQMVAIGRALMPEPRLLMLDEPTAGLSPRLAVAMFDKIGEIDRDGTAVLMVEQNARQALALAQRGYVVTLGANRAEDTGAALLADETVGAMFLGA